MKEERIQQFKYIYHVYTSNGVFHCERFPIIYINSDYVYFKRSGIKLLDIQKIKNIRSKYSVSELKFVSSINDYFNRYYLDVSEFSAEEASNFLDSYRSDKNFERIEREFQVAEKVYLERKSKYEKLLELQGENNSE